MSKKNLYNLLAVFVMVAMLLSACGPKATEAPASTLDVGIVLPTKDEPRWIQDETIFKNALASANFTAEILFSQGDSAKEKANVESLITKGVKVIIICPQDGSAAAAAAEAARAAGVKVISYDRLVLNTEAVDYYVTFDSIAVGAAQAQYLVDKATGTGNALYLYAGAASDNNAFLFFEGAWNVLQPKIADGTFVIKNSSEAVALQDKATLTRDEMGQIIGQVTTDWNFNTAKSLAESNLTVATADDKGDVFILAPNDGTARAIADVFGADSDVSSYVVTGQDAEKASVQYIIDGKQSMTVLKDVRTLVADALSAAGMYVEGSTPPQTNSYNNGAIDVPAKPSVVVTVDQSNVKEAVIDSGYWPASDFTGLDTLGAAPAAPEVSFAYAPGGALEAAIKGEYSGTTVTVDGAFEGNDPDGVKFAESMKAFEEATGITVNYVGNKEFEGSIAVRVDAGDAPDIVDFPQPGLFASFVRSGDVKPVDFISDEWLSQQYNAGWREFNTVDGVEAGLMHRYSGKSLVWYPKQAWDAAGYQVPETWDDLVALTQQIADDGDTAWCIGIESGAATGWVATDWTEDMMLRTTSLENYDAWVAGDLAFDSPEVKKAVETWSSVWFNDAFVNGGRSSIVSTFFGDAPGGMFGDPPQCWLHRQANFITSFFPEGKTYGVDYDFFYLPPVDPAYGKPFLVAGDLVAMFNDRPEVRALMEYFTTPQSASGWLEGGGGISAHQTATQDMYGSDLDWGVAQLVAGATSFRFDGSDLMPGEVGAGSFWEQMTSYVAGSVDLDTALKAIDASWPK